MGLTIRVQTEIITVITLKEEKEKIVYETFNKV